MIIAKEVRKRIKEAGTNKIYMVRDFADLDNESGVTRALSRMENEGFLVRLSHGLYLYPDSNRFGVLKPAIDEVAKAIANKDKARIIPSGLTALNILGLSTQVTMNAVYLTDSTTRVVKVGNRQLTFKRSAPRNFAYETDIFPLVVCAMKEIGEKNLTDEQMKILNSRLETFEDKEALRRDYNIAPQWIRQRIYL